MKEKGWQKSNSLNDIILYNKKIKPAIIDASINENLFARRIGFPIQRQIDFDN